MHHEFESFVFGLIATDIAAPYVILEEGRCNATFMSSAARACCILNQYAFCCIDGDLDEEAALLVINPDKGHPLLEEPHRYGILKCYILNCYMDLSCRMTMSRTAIKLLRMANYRRAKQHLNPCQIWNATLASFPLFLLLFLHYESM